MVSDKAVNAKVVSTREVKDFQGDLNEVLNEVPVAMPEPAITVPPPLPPVVPSAPPPVPEEIKQANTGRRKLVYPARPDVVCTCGQKMAKYEDGKFWYCIRFLSEGMTPSAVCKARVPLNAILDKLPEKAPEPSSLPIE